MLTIEPLYAKNLTEPLYANGLSDTADVRPKLKMSMYLINR